MKPLSPTVLLVLAAVLAGFAANATRPARSAQAWSLLLRGDDEAAVAAARAALSENENPARAAVCLVEASKRLGRQDEALDTLASYEAAHPGSGVTLLGRATVERMGRSFDGAGRFLGEALALYSDRADSLGTLVALEQLAHTLQNAGRYADAADRHGRALDLATALDDTLALISSRYGLAYSMIPTGQYDRCETLVRAALAEARSRDLHLWVGHNEALLGTLRWLRLSLDETLRHLEKAFDAYEAFGDASLQASCLRRIAATQSSRGEYPIAIETLRRARRIALDAGNVGEASFCLEHLGSVSADLGDLDLAIERWRGALEEGRDHWPAEWKAAALANIGSALVTKGEHEVALDTFERTLAALRESGSRLPLPDALQRIARLLRLSGRPEQAIERLEESIDIARELDLKLAEAWGFTELGHCDLSLGRLEEAEDAFARAASLAEGRDFLGVDIEIRSGRATVSRRRGALNEALAHLERALQTTEDARRRSREATAVQQELFGKRATLYEETVDVLFAMHERAPDRGFDADAFRVAQRAKARSLLDLLTEGDVELRVRADSTYQRREREILARLAALDAASSAGERDADARARLDDELAILERELRTADPRYADIRYPSPATLRDVRGALLEGELLLDYILGDSASYVWAVSAGGARFARLPRRAEVERAVRSFLPLVTDYNVLGGDAGYLTEPALALGRMLLSPVAEEVRAANGVVVAPYGVLHVLPFEALLVRPPEDKSSGYASLPYLVTETDVSYVPAATALLRRPRTEATSRPGRDLLVVGNPVLDASSGGGFYFQAATGTPPPPVPFVEAEMREVADRFPVGSVVTLAGDGATLAALDRTRRDGPFRFVHFATHGVYNERRPRFSGLLLSPDPPRGDDGFLSLAEVFGLDLPCEQVVLSACHSGLGEELSGEGLLGLTRGLLYAGARSVVASLWAVSGEATADFMSALYARLGRESRGSRAHELSETKRMMIRSGGAQSTIGGQPVDLAHPYFWAPFVLTGDGGR
jgi:CHAT domain-containing protein